MKRACSIIFAIVSLVFFLANSVYANLIINGDFEDENLGEWITYGDVEFADAGCFTETQGMTGYYALLGLGTLEGESGLFQVFDVSGYTHINISFNWAFDYWDSSTSANDEFLSIYSQSDGVDISGISLLDLETDGIFFHPSYDLAYGFFSMTLDISNLAGEGGLLSFKLREGPDWFWCTTLSAAGIDNVSVTPAPVPEPSTMMLLGVGLISTGLYNRMRRRKTKPE